MAEQIMLVELEQHPASEFSVAPGIPMERLKLRRPRGGSGPKTGRRTARIGPLGRPSGSPARAEATRGSAAIVSSKKSHTHHRANNDATRFFHGSLASGRTG